MKRSDMLNIIINGFKSYNPNNSMNLMEANCILEAVEKAGMLPPLQENYTLENSRSIDPFNWESEQIETKGGEVF